MWGTAQPGRLALGCSRFPADLPGFILCPLPPPSRNCTKSHGSLLQKGEFYFQQCMGWGDFNGRELQAGMFLLQEHRGCNKTAAGLPGPDRLTVLWALSPASLGQLLPRSFAHPGMKSSKGRALLHEQSPVLKAPSNLRAPGILPG